MDKNRFSKKYVLSLLSSAWTLLPVLLGATILTALWAFDIQSGLAAFASIGAILGGMGVFFTRLALGSETASAAAIDEMQEESLREREARLDALDARLVRDGDKRTQTALRDLRKLGEQFSKFRPKKRLALSDAFDIASGVEKLFTSCIKQLERSAELWEQARGLSDIARPPLEEERERIIGEVISSIEHLGKILAGMRKDDIVSRDETDLAALRNELDERIAIARRVEERIQHFEQQIDVPRESSGGGDPHGKEQ
jgi:hypothetical protein